MRASSAAVVAALVAALCAVTVTAQDSVFYRPTTAGARDAEEVGVFGDSFAWDTDSVARAVAAGRFTLLPEGQIIRSFYTDSIGDPDDTLVLVLDDSPGLGTGVRAGATLSYDATVDPNFDSLARSNNMDLLNFTVGIIESATRGFAQPVITAFAVTDDTLHLHLSEPVRDTTNTALVDMTYIDNDAGVPDAFVSLNLTDGPTINVVRLQANGAINGSDDGATVTDIRAVSFADPSHEIDPTTITFSNSSAAAIRSFRAVDLDGNGVITHMHVEFVHALDDATLTGTHDAYTAMRDGETFNFTAIDTGFFDNDRSVRLTFDPANRPEGTDGTFTLTMVDAEVTARTADFAGRLIASADTTSAVYVDRAAPTIVSASTESFRSNMTVSFSEAVTASSVDPTKFTVDFSGAAIAVLSVTALAGGADFVLELATDVGQIGQMTGGTVSFAAFDGVNGSFVDSSGNQAVARAGLDVTNSDTTPPDAPVCSQLDLDENGEVDRVRCQFAEELFGESAAAAWTYNTLAVAGIEVNQTEGFVDVLLSIASTAPFPVGEFIEYGSPANPAERLADVNGNAIMNISIDDTDILDGAAPAIASVTALHGENTVTVAYSEAVTSIASATFTVAGYSVEGAALDSGDVVLTINGTTATSDFTGSIAVTSSGAEDGAGNSLNATAGNLAPDATESAAPVFLSAATRDTNANGLVDQIVATFDTPVVGTSGAGTDGWSVAGFNVTSVDYLGTEIVRLTVTANPPVAAGSGNTAAVPDVTVTSSSTSATRLSGVAPVDTTRTAADEAGPAIVSVRADVGDMNVSVVFSEPVATALDATVFADTFEWVGSSVSLVFATSSLSGAGATVGLDGPVTKAMLVNGDGIRVGAASTAADADGNTAARAAAQTALQAESTTPPAVNTATTADVNGVADGFIDTITVTFTASIPLDNTTVSAAGWSVVFDSNHTYDVVGVVPSPDTANAVVVSISRTSALPVDVYGDTGVTPNVTYAASAGTLADLNLNEVADFVAETTDGARPVLMRFSGDVGDTDAALFFSEGMDGSAGQDSENAGVFVVTGPVSARGDADDRAYDAPLSTSNVVTLTALVDDALVLSDFNGSSCIQFSRTGSVLAADEAGNAPAGIVRCLVKQDTDAPLFVSATTGDIDAPFGFLDTITITFSEPLDAAVPIQPASFIFQNEFAGYMATSATAASSIVTLKISGPGQPDTGMLVALSYIGSGIRDRNGNPVPVIPVTAADGAPPALMLVSGLTGDDDVVMSFSEEVFSAANDTAFVPGNVVVGSFSGSLTPIAVEAAAVSGGDLTLDMDRILAEGDFGDMQLTANAATFFDIAGNAASAATKTLVQRNPVIVSASTVATGAEISGVEVTFSLPMDNATLAAATGDFTISSEGNNLTITSITPKDGASVPTYVFAVSGATGGTGVTPALSYSGTSVVDADSGLALLPTETPFDVADGAPAALVSAKANVGDSTVRLTFSEPVSANPGGGAIPISAVNYVDAGGVITGVSGAAFADLGEGVYEVDVTGGGDGSFTLDDFAPGDTVALVADAVQDANGNASPASAPVRVTIEDEVRPEIESASTLDLDGDGVVDAIDVFFTKSLSVGSVGANDFTVTGASVTGFAVMDRVAGSADSVVRLTVSGLGVDTAVRPEVAIDGDVSDRNGNVASTEGSETQAADGAAPVVTAVTGRVGESSLAIVLSEPVTGTLDLSGIVFSGDGVAPPKGATNVTFANGAYVIDLNGTVLVEDFAANVTVAIDGTVFADAGGNAGSSQVVRVTNAVLAPATAGRVETRDMNGDGVLDHLVVFFSDSIVESTVDVAEQFSVAGYTVSAASGDSVADTADDGTLWIAIAATGLDANEGDTGATPELVYSAASGAIVDVHGYSVEDFSAPTTDTAPPAVVYAAANPGTNTIFVRLSEPVDLEFSGGNKLALVSSDFAYRNTNSDGALGIRSVEEQSSDTLEVTLQSRGVVTASDISADGVGLAPRTVRDLAGNVVEEEKFVTLEGDTSLGSGSESSSSTNSVAIGVGSAAAFFGILLIVILACIKRKKDKEATDDKSVEMRSSSQENITTDGGMQQYNAASAVPESSSRDNLVGAGEGRESVAPVSGANALREESVPPAAPPGDPSDESDGGN